MADDVKDLVVRLTLENDQLKKALDDTKKATQKSETAFGKFGQNVKKHWFALTAAIGGTVLALTKVIKSAIDSEETFSKFNTVFSKIRVEADKTAKELVKGFGLSSTKARELLGATGDLLTGFGFTQEEALRLSGEVNKLAVDLASFTNAQGGAEAVSQALTKALLGERESLKTYGIAIMETDVQQQLFRKGQQNLTGESLRQAKAQATLELALKQSKNAIGDFQRTQKNTANQLRILGSSIDDIITGIGVFFKDALDSILPVLNSIVDKVADWARGMREARAMHEQFQKTLDAEDSILRKYNITTKEHKDALFKLGHAYDRWQGAIMNIKLAQSELSKTNRDASQDLFDWNKELEYFTKQLKESGMTMTKYKKILEETQIKTGKEASKVLETLTQDSYNLVDATEKAKVEQEKSAEAIKQEMQLRKSLFTSAINEEIKLREQIRELKGEDELTAQQELQLQKDRIRELIDFQSAANQEQVLLNKIKNNKILESDKEKLEADKKLDEKKLETHRTTLGLISGLAQSTNKTLFTIGKAAALADAIINTAQGVTKTLASYPFPVNIPLAALVGAAGAVQIDKISNTKLPTKRTGGIIDEVYPAAINGEDGIIAVQRGESVLNRQATAVLGRDAIDALNSGRSVSAPVSINIYGGDKDEIVDILNDYFRQAI